MLSPSSVESDDDDEADTERKARVAWLVSLSLSLSLSLFLLFSFFFLSFSRLFFFFLLKNDFQGKVWVASPPSSCNLCSFSLSPSLSALMASSLPPNLIHTVYGNYILRPNIFQFSSNCLLDLFSMKYLSLLSILSLSLPSWKCIPLRHQVIHFDLFLVSFAFSFPPSIHAHLPHKQFGKKGKETSRRRKETRGRREGEKKQEQKDEKGRKCNKKWNSATTHPTVFPWMMDSDIFNRKTVSPEVACCPSFSLLSLFQSTSFF